jgi:hypothetical protein
MELRAWLVVLTLAWPQIVAARAAIGAQVVAWLHDAPSASGGGDCGWSDSTAWGVAVNAVLACVTVAAAAVMLRLATRRAPADAAREAAPALAELHAPLLDRHSEDEAEAEAQQAADDAAP